MSRAHLTITVVPQFLDEQSHPERDEYAFSYAVTVVNTGEVAAQVIGRHWVITDATGKVEEVKGLGLVGHQPLIQPGAQFDYSSWTRLGTPHGIMHGEFYCVTEDMEFFEAPIEPFALVRSKSLH
ncbi:MAG TPA: Co2+/Mg2+ efflux protein ApaG [Aquabacterium sp.]|nr:Co2+/Mg2+ efflux protein ApaG [Aquabacterium sp.]